MEYLDICLTEAIPPSLPGAPNGLAMGQRGKLEHQEQVRTYIGPDGKIRLGTWIRLPEEERVDEHGRKTTITPMVFVPLDALKSV